ncbi:MAG TPA: hypothetical protein VFO77_15435 [Actinoplanes sp.]|nr:hypothetical protein [Actinoplanes sp.]
MREPAARRAVGGTLGAALAAAVAFLLAPPMGTDLSAQTARADFFARHGGAVLDLGWYGGVSPYGYSLLTPAPMAWFGVREVGAGAAVLSAVLLVVLLLRTGARRPVAGGLLGVVGIFGNLVSGRVTFAVGVLFALAALVAVTLPGRRRWVGVTAGALLAAGASPVAGLFVGLAAAGLLLTGAGRRVDAMLLGAGAALPMSVMALLFGVGGRMNISGWDTLRAVTAGLLVAWLVPRRPVRVAAALSAAGVLAAFLIATPVGLNAVRLAAMFTLPVLAGYAVLPQRLRLAGASGAQRAARVALPVVLVAVGLWQPPVSVADLRGAGAPTASVAYFRPLLDELRRRGPVGRIEVVPTGDYWEAAYVAGVVPLARGWLRQADIDRNPLFFDGSLDAERYRRWLHRNGVRLVAIASAAPSWVGRREAELIRGGLPYLTPVWRTADWTLYEVAGEPSIVNGASLVSSTGRALTVDVAAGGAVTVRVRWSRWLRLRGPGCLAPAADGWTTLRVPGPGRYRLTSGFTAGPRC